jgi:Helix-loop-helix DNA-binding domain
MHVDEFSPVDETMDTEQNESLVYHPDRLPTSATWSARRVQPTADNTARAQTDGSMAEWVAPEYWQSPLYDLPDTPGGSPIFTDVAVQKSTALPLFLKGSDLQIAEPLSASSSSFSPEQLNSPFRFGATVEPSSQRTSLKRSPSTDQSGIPMEVEEVVKPKPKRGRPRLPRNEPHICDTSEFPCTHVIDNSLGSQRVPHNQVEQKYRNGLNAELERLRETVAVAPSRVFAHLSNSSAKPSKAMILASAIDYIKSIEAERDQLADENEVLRGRNKRLRREKKTNGNE